MSRIVTFGEIMLRLKTPRHLRIGQAETLEASFGGGEANVAVSLAGFGLEVDFVTRLTENQLGDAALSVLRGHGVGTRHIVRGGDRLGIYFLESGAAQRASQVLYDRAHSSMAQIEPGMIDWEEVFDGAGWFHWTGITPALSRGAAAACREAVAAARAAGLTVSVDLNYRAKLWKWGKRAREVMPELVARSDVIFANEEDADRVFGIPAVGADVTRGQVDAAPYEAVARRLMREFPDCRTVAITLRGSFGASHNTWSAVLFNGEELIQGPCYDIAHIVDRVGGGDAFAAGLIYGLHRWPGEDRKCLEFAVAAACLKHTVHGDFNLVTVAEVEKLMSGDASGRVAR